MVYWARSTRLLGVIVTAGVCWACVSQVRAAEPEEAQYNVVVTLFNAGQWQAAIKRITEREKLDLTPAMRARYQYVRAMAYERGGKTDEARAAYEQLATKFPTAPEVVQGRMALLYLDYGAGKFDGVIANYGKIDVTRLSAADQKNLSLMYAESLYAKKDDKGALAAYQLALQRGADPNSLAAKLFDLYSRLGMHAKLLEVSAKGVTGLPADAVALARAEALIAQSKWNEVDAEAQKVPAQSKYYPRAAFARAQSLLRQNKLKEAVVPLEAAVKGLKDPPAPPAAHVALAECLLEVNRGAEVPAILATAEKGVAAIKVEADRKKLQGQIALLRLRAAVPSGDRKGLIKNITDNRATLPKEQLGKVLYLRLFALSEEKDHKTILETMKEDLPIFQAGGDELGPATLIYISALREQKRAPEGLALLDDLVRRKPAVPEVLKGRLLIANEALSRSDFPAARAQFDAVAANPQAAQQLGKATFDEMQFNRAVTTQKAKQPDQALAILRALVASAPVADLARQANLLLGQLLADKQDYAGAIAAWKLVLPNAKPAEEADVRDRLARVLYANKDYAGTIEQIPLATKAAGPTGLSKEAKEVWARALFSTNKFAEAAVVFQGLAETFKEMPVYAYEAAVAYEKAGKPADAEKWYSVAVAAKSKLPPTYAGAVDANLAAMRFKSGAGDMGATQWVNQLTQAKDEKAFETAITALRKVSTAGKLDAATREALDKLLKPLAPTQARRYALGALLLEAIFNAGDKVAASKLSAELVSQFAENEKKLDAKSMGATLAPAIIHFYRGECLRQEQNWGEALAEYETVLSAYPYNEWPDAAACGAAECYLALNDKDTAIKKFQEVADAKPAPGTSNASSNSAVTRWRELARKRLGELAKGKGN